MRARACVMYVRGWAGEYVRACGCGWVGCLVCVCACVCARTPLPTYEFVFVFGFVFGCMSKRACLAFLKCSHSFYSM